MTAFGINLQRDYASRTESGAVLICGPTFGPIVEPRGHCKHRTQELSYTAFIEDSEVRTKIGERQTKCPHCMLFVWDSMYVEHPAEYFYRRDGVFFTNGRFELPKTRGNCAACNGRGYSTRTAKPGKADVVMLCGSCNGRGEQ